MLDVKITVHDATEADWSLDSAGVRVQHVDDGLLLDTDLVKARRAQAGAGAIAALAGVAMVAFIPDFVRWFGILFLAVGLVFIFKKPRDERCSVTPKRIGSTASGGRVVEAAAVTVVRLERREVVRGSGKNRRTVVEWPVRLAGVDWFFANSRDRAKARRLAEDVAIVLGKPFVDATGPVEREVPADAVNMDVRERLRRGIVKAEAPGPRPPRVTVREVHGGTEYAFPRRLWLRALGFGVPALFIVLFDLPVFLTLLPIIVAEPDLWAILIVPGLFFVVGAVLLVSAALSLVGEDHVRATPHGVEYGARRFGLGRTRSATLDGVEDVRAIKGVHLVGDTVDVPLGFAYAPPEVQAWIAAALLHDLARRS